MNGIINIYKEKNFTSHDVVAKLRGILKIRKIGHTGTLDPDAVGVLPICINRATKVCDMLTDKDKVYETVMLLGVTTDTQDTSGEILLEKEVTANEEEVKAVINTFVGEYAQIPPMYSALKVNGKKLYELAREGIEIERKARNVTIYSIEILEVSLPRVRMRVHCSKGTYIRTLCHDIGIKLNCGACMEELKRTKVSIFDIKDAYTLAEVETIMKDGKIEEIIMPIDKIFCEYKKLSILEQYDKLVYNGNKFKENCIEEKYTFSQSEQCRVYDSKGEFVGVYEYVEKYKEFKPVKIFMI
ncbi:MAG: tRNA pseudouridine(55) synthase TruB [Lachnospiraceae bacterium]|nr:tRNA pseudouridine(55) synthase TruB [Lachnospiraceae bacterium]